MLAHNPGQNLTRARKSTDYSDRLLGAIIVVELLQQAAQLGRGLYAVLAHLYDLAGLKVGTDILVPAIAGKK
jgi:hypothetical protein